MRRLLVVTFGKGFGVSGAAVLCSNTVADYLLQFARHLIYSTSMPPAQAQAVRASLAVIRSDEGDARREKLAALITRFRAGVQDLPITLAGSCSAIQPLIVGDNSRALQLAEKLRRCDGLKLAASSNEAWLIRSATIRSYFAIIAAMTA